MARARVKNIKTVTQSFIKDLKGNINKNIARENKDKIEFEIISTILSGQSPVKGERFKKYNQQYANREKGGAVKPVDMNLTGKMLDSLEVKQVRGRPGLLIRFNDTLATIHDKLGAGKSKVIRRLLPRNNEQFKSNIERSITRFFRNVIRKATR